MLINSQNLSGLYTGFKTSFNKGWSSIQPTYTKFAVETNSTTSKETYPWLGQFPQMREWIGDRIVKSLSVSGFAIENRDFEMTISVPRNVIEDDQYGVFGPMFENMGAQARSHPDQLSYELLGTGFTVSAYDGQPFFDIDHVSYDERGNEISASNVQTGDGPAWYLLDTSKVLKPLVFQKRKEYSFIAIDKPDSPNVFYRREYIYGVEARASVGFVLYQLAFASKAPLTVENYEAARTAMGSFRGEHGQKLNVTPNLLVVPRELEGAARRLVISNTRVVVVGEGDAATSTAVTNEWAGTAELIVSPYL